MSKIPSILEQQLNVLKPSGLDDAFLLRLTSSAEGLLLQPTAEELEFVSELRAITPRRVSSGMHSKLCGIIGDTPFAADEKIVFFNKSKSLESSSKSGKRTNIIRLNLAAAAAVAILGSLAALMLPGGESSKVPLVSSTPVGSNPVSSQNSENYIPASYNRNLSDTRDEGVIWQTKNQSHRVLRLTYTERVTLKNEKGGTVEVEQPRVEYVIIPEKID
ncbi:MAG: hypothetical protein H7Y36_04620 [Armatimonadetes bacterium]|nr:hypothetical protein [Akkermansiaceae bacterium]